MKEHGILFSAPMVTAILAGRKTQTRRLQTSPLARAQVGDRLWVRETWAVPSLMDAVKPRDIPPDACSVRYYADDHIRPSERTCDALPLRAFTKKRVAIHMPRWASRITLEITGTRIEWLQDISEEDAEAEGMPEPYLGDGDPPFEEQAVRVSRRMQYRNLWKELHGAESWDHRQKVLVLEFRRIENG